MVKLKTYTPEERALRRSGTSIITERPILTNATEDFNESWFDDLRDQGVDIEEFLKDVIEPGGDTDDDASASSEVHSVIRRMSRLSKTQQQELIRRITLSTDNEAVKQRFSSFFGQTYEYDPVTGAPVLLSAEEVEKRKWEKEVEEDCKHFDPKGTSAETREKNRQWAIEMARKHVVAAGFEPEVDYEDTPVDTSPSDIETDIPQPPPIDPLPLVEELDLGPTPKRVLGPRSIGIMPPSLPHKLTDVIPKLSRSDIAAISSGIVVDGSLEDGWATCDASTMVVSCINEECVSYLRCPRFASLVRCSSCNTVSPATCLPLPVREQTVINESG